jgi:hypothetical protein
MERIKNEVLLAIYDSKLVNKMICGRFNKRTLWNHQKKLYQKRNYAKKLLKNFRNLKPLKSSMKLFSDRTFPLIMIPSMKSLTLY